LAVDGLRLRDNRTERKTKRPPNGGLRSCGTLPEPTTPSIFRRANNRGLRVRGSARRSRRLVAASVPGRREKFNRVL